MTTTPPGAGLGAMIRTWRNRLPPSAAGLPVVRKRRAVGLRREELADLAGVSVDYVVRLEQGRATTPSASVVASLARALQLSTAERDHLYRLARIVPPAPARSATISRPVCNECSSASEGTEATRGSPSCGRRER
jgi:transcriptional regulator with XRE-family HTH domain